MRMRSVRLGLDAHVETYIACTQCMASKYLPDIACHAMHAAVMLSDEKLRLGICTERIDQEGQIYILGALSVLIAP